MSSQNPHTSRLPLYQKLNRNEIRLLLLHASIKPSDPPTCELVTVSLESDGLDYRALSYCWNSQLGSKNGIVNGQEKQMTTNLVAALKHLRSSKELLPRHLWVDALCINQDDDDEKATQVALMGRIYSQATKVLVWIPGFGDKKCLRAIASIAADKSLHWIKDHVATQRAREPFIKFDRRKLLDFYHDHWFSRVWTFQEAVLAREVVYFTQQGHVSNADLSRMHQSLALHVRPGGCCFGGVDSSWNQQAKEIVSMCRQNQALALLATQNGQTRSFIHAASLARWRQATNPLDKVYGVLGLVSDMNTNIINYSLSPAEVYARTAAGLIDKEKSLDVLYYKLPPALWYEPRPYPNLFFQSVARRLKTGWVDSLIDIYKEKVRGRDTMLDKIPPQACPPTPNLPSWAPDWNATISFDRTFTIHERLRTFHPFSAAGDTQATTASVDPQNASRSRLRVGGVFCDAIERVGFSWNHRYTSKLAAIKDWHALAGIGAEPDAPYHGAGAGHRAMTRTDAFARTVCNDVYPNEGDDSVSAEAGEQTIYRRWGSDVELSRQVRRLYDTLWDLLPEHFRDLDHMDGRPADDRSFVETLRTMAIGRRFFVTAGGYMGLAAVGAQPGDQIWVMAGGRVPFVLRPVSGAFGSAYHSVPAAGMEHWLVGDAYVQGIMDGELTRETDAVRWENVVLQ